MEKLNGRGMRLMLRIEEEEDGGWRPVIEREKKTKIIERKKGKRLGSRSLSSEWPWAAVDENGSKIEDGEWFLVGTLLASLTMHVLAPYDVS